jgi:hypothetical protein
MGKAVHTCHTKGKFFKFASTTSSTIILDTLPGPVTVFNTRLFKFTLETPKPTPATASAATVLTEIFVAPAMVMRRGTRNVEHGGAMTRGMRAGLARTEMRGRLAVQQAQAGSHELKKNNKENKSPQRHEADRAEGFSLA